MKHIVAVYILLIFLCSYRLLEASRLDTISPTYTSKYTRNDVDGWRREMTDQIIDLKNRIEELEDQNDYLTKIIDILIENMERENDLLEMINQDLETEINMLKLQHLEQIEINNRFFSYMMYR